MKLTLRFAVVLLMAAMSSLAFGQDLQDKFFDSNGVRIRYIEQGTGEPVVRLIQSSRVKGVIIRFKASSMRAAK